MTKRELIQNLKACGPKGVFAAGRIVRSAELEKLSDDAEITPALIEKWIEESPIVNNKLSVRGGHPPLSESDLQCMAKLVR
jgi:hypothetical protein